MCARVFVLILVLSSGLATWCLAFQDARAPGNSGQRIIPGHTHPYPYPGYYDDDPDPPDPLYPVQHAGLPRELAAEPLPLPASDHELMFNVSWLPSLGPPARDYSLEVHSDTDTADCRMTMCYEYNIPGSATWWSIPAQASPVTETCAVRPGCAYRVRLVAHPWDGHTAATLRAQLAECVAGVCSCAHSPRLPAPLVSAHLVGVGGDTFVNVSWTLPPPMRPQRLPKGLQKKSYFVSIGQQMVSDAHPSPWFAHTVTRHVSTDGPVATGEEPRFLLLPTVDKSRQRKKVLDVRLLARVSVVDERGCMGPAGNATAFDPAKASQVSIITYILWASLGGALALGAVGALVCGARAAKVVLRALRPSPVSPREPRRAWFPLPLPTCEGPSGVAPPLIRGPPYHLTVSARWYACEAPKRVGKKHESLYELLPL